MKEKPTKKTLLTEEEILEIRRAYHSLEAFQQSPEHRVAKENLKARLAKGDPEKPEAN
jgi:hypothetical protein